MITSTFALLDQAELLQLALNASAANDSASTIAYLKESVSRTDATATAHYLLGAEYAQIKMYERAIGEMEAAIALDPALSIARLQLGLLWLGANNNVRAADVLRALDELGESDPLRLFGAGLQQLIGEQLAEALQSLGAGVAMNTSNEALNGDMRSIMRQIEQVMAGSGAPVPEAAAAADDSQHILLSAYTGGQRH
jgi:tetratricopeptide (TPR) repeat protein